MTVSSIMLASILLSGCVTSSTGLLNQSVSLVPINTPSALTNESVELKTLPFQGKLYAAMLAPTGSMRPTLADNDLILYTKHVDFQSINIGDIVLFKNPESKTTETDLVCHRVVGRMNKGLRTKGDNNSQCDPTRVHQKNLYGKLVGVIRGIEPQEPIATIAASF